MNNSKQKRVLFRLIPDDYQIFKYSFSEYHIQRRLLRTPAMGRIHLAEVPLHPDEDVPAHDEAVAVFYVVVRDRMREIARLVQDVVNFDTQVEGADILGNFCIPLPFRLAIAFGVALVKDVGEIRIELELVLGGVRASCAQSRIQRIQIGAWIQRVTGDAAGGTRSQAERVMVLVESYADASRGRKDPGVAFGKPALPAIEAVAVRITPEIGHEA